MVSRDLLLSYFEVAKNLNLISNIELHSNKEVLRCIAVNKQIYIYLDLRGYEKLRHIYLNIYKYTNKNVVDKIEITKCFRELKGNELEHFNLILNEIIKLDKLFNNYNY